MNCPTHSAKGVPCKFPDGHPLPHKGTSETGRTVTWGFRTADRPMYPGNTSRAAEAPFTDVSVTTLGGRCQSAYSERGLVFQCVKDENHMGTQHRNANVRWTA